MEPNQKLFAAELLNVVVGPMDLVRQIAYFASRLRAGNQVVVFVHKQEPLSVQLRVAVRHNLSFRVWVIEGEVELL